MAVVDLFPQIVLPAGPSLTPYVAIPDGIRQLEFHITALDQATSLDLTLEKSENGGPATDASGVTGAIPMGGKPPVFVGEIAWTADLYPATGPFARVSGPNTRLRVRAVNNSGKAVTIGPGTITLS